MTIAVRDDGVDFTHPEFENKVGGFNSMTGNQGSYVAGIAVARHNITGMVGVTPDARLLATNIDNSIECDAWKQAKVAVAVMSFDATCKKGVADLENALKFMFEVSHETVIAASAGQEGGGATHGYPAAWVNEDWVDGRMIAVASVDRNEAVGLGLQSRRSGSFAFLHGGPGR